MDNSFLDCESRMVTIPNGIRYVHPVYGYSHRTDGPAVIFHDGGMGWYVDGVWLSFDMWCARLDKTPSEITALRIEYDI